MSRYNHTELLESLGDIASEFDAEHRKRAHIRGDYRFQVRAEIAREAREAIRFLHSELDNLEAEASKKDARERRAQKEIEELKGEIAKLKAGTETGNDLKPRYADESELIRMCVKLREMESALKAFSDPSLEYSAIRRNAEEIARAIAHAIDPSVTEYRLIAAGVLVLKEGSRVNIKSDLNYVYDLP